MKIKREKAEKTLQLVEGLILQHHPKMKGLDISQMLNKLLPDNCYIVSEPVVDLNLLGVDSDISFLIESEPLLESLMYEEPLLTLSDELYACSCSCHLGK